MKTKMNIPPALRGKPRLAFSALAGLLVLMLAALSAQAATLTYNFSDGLQGWTQIGSTTRAPWNSGGNAWGSTGAGSIYGYDGDDGTDNTYWVRSPEFQLDGSGSLTVHFWGGKSNAAAPANESEVPTVAIQSAGFKGVVLRDVATGNFVKSFVQTTDGANADYSLSATDLAPYTNDGKRYTLDFLDYDYGGWGWVGLDNVTIPGALMQATLAPAYASVLNGGSTSITLGIPLGVNASTAVTVYLTNSDPAAITLNGSSAGVVPVVFGAGAANSQTVTVIATGLGVVHLGAGASGMASTTSSVKVLSASGLMGRWLTGTEDLADKSGYTPAGIHDGRLADGMTPLFVADVPPGAPLNSMSLDIGASGAVMITNSAVADAGYRRTFDEGNAMQMSVVFWAKGLPANWNPFVTKYGEGSTGWQVRKRGDAVVSTFTVRSTGGEDDPFNGTTLIDDGGWHQFAATFDGVSGTRKLYVDGKLNLTVPHDGGPMGLANVNYLTLGGRCDANSATPGNLLGGNLFDVQIYGIALDGSAVQRLFTGDTASVVAYAENPIINVGQAGTVSVSIPASANASSPVTVYVTNTTPAVASLAGAVGNVATLTFAAGGVTSQMLSLTGLTEGQAQLACASTALTGASVAVKVNGPHLVGRWFDGSETTTDKSGFTPAGTHDGTQVGTGAGTLAFSTDTPPSKTGKSAQLSGSVGLSIDNSSALDANYVPTFDEAMRSQFSVAFWAKGLPGQWGPFVTKRGEDEIGWQVRRHGSNRNETFTIRGSPGSDDPQGALLIDDGNWHHFAAVWDGVSGTRKCYVDGVLDANINFTGDFGPMMQANNHHLVLGGRETSGVSTTPGFEGGFNGLLYDVRVYNYPLSLQEVKDLSFVAAVTVIPATRSLAATSNMTVQVVLPAGANQSQQVIVNVTNTTPTLISLSGAVNNVLALTYPVGSSLTQQVSVVGITDGQARLTAAGGGFAMGTGVFNVYSDPGYKLIAHWFSGEPTFAETSGFRPAGKHDAVPVAGGNGDPNNVRFSTEVPSVAPVGAQSLDLSSGNIAVVITNSATIDPGYVETFDGQMANKFSITFWAKGTPNAGDWNPWISKRGEDGRGYQVRRFGGDDPIRPTFTIRGTPGDDDPWINTTVDNDTWHHYAATWDGANGTRRLYLDGTPILTMSRDTGPMALATTDHLMLGARDSGSFGNFFPGLLYDVRIYSYALAAEEVGVMVNPPTAFSLTLAPVTIPMGDTVQLIVTVPASATATSPVTVFLTNNSPNVVSIVGSTSLTFPVGTAVQVVTLRTIGLGNIDISAGLAGVGSATLTTVNTVIAPKLIGHWISGPADLTDKSGFTAPGTHDGIVVGANPEALAFSTDVPAGLTGQSLDLTTNATAGVTVGVAIANSAMTDPNYQNTFDEGMGWAFSVAFWAKGYPTDWNGFVSKRGENGIGWQLRRHGGDTTETFTIRGSGSRNEDPNGSIAINNGQWHHFVGVWDGALGIRKCYVDGVLDPAINLTADFGPMSLAPNHHVGLGARESNGTGSYESWFAGKLFDVRLYNYPLSQAEVTSLAVVVPPSLAIKPWTGNQVRIAWPTSFAGYALEQATSATGTWGASALTVTVEGSDNVVYAPNASGPLFFRLKK